jgi:hypothetical protein
MLEEARMALSLPSLSLYAEEQAPVSPPSPPLCTSCSHHQLNNSAQSVITARKNCAAFDQSDGLTVASSRSSASFWSRLKQRNKKEKQKRQQMQQQIVANFFDVQSVTSNPEMRKKDQRQRYMESRSVTSKATSVSTLRRIFSFMKWNDEIDAGDDEFKETSLTAPIQLGGYLDLDEDDAFTIDDEELTVASGLDMDERSAVLSWNSSFNNNASRTVDKDCGISRTPL